MKRTSKLLLLAAFLVLHPGPSAAQTVVVPNANATVEGNANNVFPFNIAAAGLSSMRYQQVYASTQFSAITGPTPITTITFRPDLGSGSAFSSTLSNVQINLSTTAAAPDGLSTTFASNVGGNDTVVFSGPLTLSSANTGGPPRNFDIVINLQTPFTYDPAGGNLLLDVRNFNGGGTTAFDAQNATGDSVSRMVSSTNGVNSPVANFGDSLGLVTQFTFSPIPEPSTIALGGLGAAASAWLLRRRRPRRVAFRKGG